MVRSLEVVGVGPVVPGVSDERERLEDLVVAVMGISKRYRSVLGRFGDLEQIDEILRDRRDPMSWSALERIRHVADAVHSSAKYVVAVVDGDAPSRAPVHDDAPRAGSNGAPSRAVLAALHASAADLARAASRVEAERSGEDLVTQVSGVLEEVLHDAELHLTEVEAMLDAATGRPMQPA